MRNHHVTTRAGTSTSQKSARRMGAYRSPNRGRVSDPFRKGETMSRLRVLFLVLGVIGLAVPVSAQTIQVNPATAANFGVYVEDGAETAGGNLVMVGCVRRDTAASSGGTDGDNSTINCDATGYLYTRDLNSATIAGNTGLTADRLDTLLSSLASEVAHDDPASASGPQLMGECDDSSTDAVDEGDAGRLRVNCTTRALLVMAVANSGVDIGDVTLTAGDNDVGNVDLEFAGTAASVGIGASGAAVMRVVQAQQSIFRSIDLDESEEEINASAGEVCSVWVTNTATSTRFLKFYNATAANVTVGTTTPVITIGIPGNTADDVSGSLGINNGCLAFGTAISAAATTGVADNDTGAPGANEVIVMVGYR